MSQKDNLRSLELRRNQLSEELRRDRENLRMALVDVRSATREAISLKHRIRRNPSAWILGALVAGFILGVRKT